MPAVVKRAAIIARADHAKLTLGHIVDSAPYERAHARIDYASLCEDARARILGELKRHVAADLRSADIEDVSLVVRAGPIIPTLHDLISQELHPDLVVCGKRRLSGIEHALSRSVSAHLVRHLRCDVLVVESEST